MMRQRVNVSDYDQLREIFLLTYALPDAARRRHLDQCGVTGAQRADLARMLRHHDELGAFLDPPSVPANAFPLPTSAPLPSRIGEFRVLELLGEGGMGVVYKAEQEHPRRAVALKVVRQGIASPRALRRFEHEAELLGRLQHPGIAQVYAAGRAESGEPFFAMELVDGVRLDAFARQRKLPTRERLELFVRVCDAVHHAHQKGVIHCDLKPGNILVDHAGQPKVLDFGVARATDHDLQATTLRTEMRQVAGTIPYMSPEQASGDLAQIDVRSDVFALGVVCYELLSETLPYDVIGKTVVDALRMIQQDEPTPLSARNRVFRGDLATITSQALAKDKTRRYQSAQALSDDVRRYLDGVPIAARPPALGYVLGLWVRRRKAVAAIAAGSVVLLLAATAISLALWRDARDQEATAKRASSEKEDQRKAAQASLDKFNLLAGVVTLQDAKDREQKLYPASPDNAGRLRDWLRDFGAPLQQSLPGLRAALAELHGRAHPWTPEDQEAQRQSHPRLPELERLRAQVTTRQRASEAREGRAVPLPDLDASTTKKTAIELNQLAWPLVDPDRSTHGQEAFGLACMQLALGKVEHGDASYERYAVLATLALAYHANGRDDEAMRCSKEAGEKAPRERAAEYAAYTAWVGKLVDDARGAAGQKRRTELAEQIAKLDAVVAERREFAFADGADRFLHQALSRLVNDLTEFTGKHGELAAVQRRLAEAETVRQRSIDDHRAAWDQAIAAVANSDGVVASTLYAHVVLAPQLGLVPIGMDPASKLWEFAHLASGGVAARDPGSGSLVIADTTGIVFVLLPGGTFTMGAQKDSNDKPNFDPDARPDETPHAVTLAPFFFAKYEMTQGQWLHVASGENPSFFKAGSRPAGQEITLRNPVEQVSWPMCDTLMTRHEMCLPTEAQWEYACRAGTTTPWSSGADRESLRTPRLVANLADQAAIRIGAETWAGIWPELDDGFAMHAPVGNFAPNGFGLHDMHGNESEWCQDWYLSYQNDVRPGDGLRLGGQGEVRVLRGGSHGYGAFIARSAYRYVCEPSIRNGGCGLRPARPVME